MSYRKMNDMLDQKAKDFGEYIVTHGATIRKTADFFCVSKSYVHTLVKNRLRDVDAEIYDEAMKVISKNKAERCSRGGMATRRKYQELRNKK